MDKDLCYAKTCRNLMGNKCRPGVYGCAYDGLGNIQTITDDYKCPRNYEWLIITVNGVEHKLGTNFVRSPYIASLALGFEHQKGFKIIIGERTITQDEGIWLKYGMNFTVKKVEEIV